MAKKKKNEPGQAELPIVDAQKPDGEVKAGPSKNGNGNGKAHVLAEQVPTNLAHPHRPFNPAKIELPLHRRVNTNFLE